LLQSPHYSKQFPIVHIIPLLYRVEGVRVISNRVKPSFLVCLVQYSICGIL
jgi:hypothetical protein